VVAPHRHVLFRFTTNHKKEAVDGMLKNYPGFLLADAHTVYDHLYSKDEKTNPLPATEVACWSHARRYFFKALESDAPRATHALGLMGTLFKREREWLKLHPDRRLELRTEHSAPVVKTFFAWAEQQATSVLAETPMSRALTYALNQREALNRFLENGRLPLHNNESERQLRREAVGRKNWLFVGSDDGAAANATFVSLIASCQLHGIEPWAYLRDLFCLLPTWPHANVLELAPHAWKETAARTDVIALLNENPYRNVTLQNATST
jgi:hypothetical protein